MNAKLPKLILPAFVVLALSYAGLRLVPIDALCNRALECALLYREPTGPFRANAHYQFDRVCGDLPRMSNETEYCVWREETFITDQYGFRNSGHEDSSYESVVFGDSFAYGQGSTQSEMPSAALTTALNHPVYNGAGKTELRYLRSVLDSHPAIREVFYLHLERHPRRPSELSDYDEGFRPRDFSLWRRLREQWKIYNPMQIVAGKLDRKLIQLGVLPNRFSEAVSELATETSGTHLFYPPTAHLVRADDTRVREEVAFFQRLQERLKQRGISLRVVLIPEKFAVYQGDPARVNELHLSALDRALKDAGIPSVHLLPVFQKEVRTAIERSTPLYWQDDTHWSPRGIQVMARAVAGHYETKKGP